MTTSSDELRQEEHVLTSPISDERVASFYSEYLESRRQCGAAEVVFEQAEAFSRDPNWEDQYGIGFNVIIRKGPFVERSNWAKYSAWDFALPIERHLLGNLDALLRANAQLIQEEPIQKTWSSMFSAASELLFKPAFAGSNSCIVVTGPLQENWLLDLTRQPGAVPDWELPRELNRTWIHGKYHGALILHIAESVASNLFVLNVPQFAKMTQHGSPQFEVLPIDEQRAKALLDQRSDLANGSDPIRDLMLKVTMRIYEGWSFDPLDLAAAFSVQLAAPSSGT